MTQTPWGDASDLRSRKLSAGRGTPAEVVARNQRERLFAALVATIGEKGYEATTVGDLVQLSGVSRRSFYAHFADKEECALAALDEILEAARALTAAQMREEGTWEMRAQSALRTFAVLLREQPTAARLCLVDSYAVGPEAIQRVDAALTAFEDLLRQAFDELPERRGMPVEITRAMMGGLRKVVHTRLHRGAEAELVELVPDLVDLGLTYRPPPRPLRGTSQWRGGNHAPETAGNAAVAASVPQVGEDAVSRIIRATMEVVATNGYQAATVGEIAKVAKTSLRTFYEHFDGKQNAFDASLYRSRAGMVAATVPAYRQARNWPESIRALTQSSLDFLSTEPEFARLITADVYAAGAEALERRDRAIEAGFWTLDGGLEYVPDMKPIAREAIISAIYAMLSDWVHREGAASLPEMAPLATYMALAPFIGAADACTVANGGRWH